ncbi:MAG: type II toxin-antitoxin system RelE/ParE family toxin [Waddliaceae bacterium]
MAIKFFGNKKLEKFFETGSKSGIQPHHAAKLERILDRLDTSADIRDMDYPDSELHQLTGKWKNYWSVKVNGNYRVWFRFEKFHAYDVQYGDYH